MPSDKKPDTQNRKHFRVKYPFTDRPKFECQGKKYEIIDVSEQGLAFHIDPKDGITQSKVPLHGRIHFKSGDTATVAGKILRTNEDSVIILLHITVPFATIMKEQRYMLQKYGKLEQ